MRFRSFCHRRQRLGRSDPFGNKAERSTSVAFARCSSLTTTTQCISTLSLRRLLRSLSLSSIRAAAPPLGHSTLQSRRVRRRLAISLSSRTIIRAPLSTQLDPSSFQRAQRTNNEIDFEIESTSWKRHNRGAVTPLPLACVSLGGQSQPSSLKPLSAEIPHDLSSRPHDHPAAHLFR